MRTLHADLTAAQKAASRVPYIPVVFENKVASFRRHDFTTLDTSAHAGVKHDCGVTADGALHRVRTDSAGNVYHQRISNPAAGPYTTWTTLAAGKAVDGAVAVAGEGTRVMVVYLDAAQTGVKMRESTDSGVTFAAEAAVVTAGGAVNDLAAAYKFGSADILVAFTRAAALEGIRRTSGAWSTIVAAGAVATATGVGCDYSPASDWYVAITGTEVTTTRKMLATALFGDGAEQALNTWSALKLQHVAESDSSLVYRGVYVANDGSNIRINFVIDEATAGGAARTWRTVFNSGQVHTAGPFAIRTPSPMNDAQNQGVAIAYGGSPAYFYECTPDLVSRAAASAVTYDATLDVLTLTVDEGLDTLRGELVLNNDAGQYASLPAAIAVGNLVRIEWGYYTVSGNRTSPANYLWVRDYEYRRDAGRSVLRVELAGFWSFLRDSYQRFTVLHTGGDVVSTVAQHIAQRAGFLMSNPFPSSRWTTIAPQFTVHTAESGAVAMRRLLELVADQLRPQSDKVEAREPLTGDASAYTYGSDHPIRALRIRPNIRPAHSVLTFGSAASAYGEANDYAQAQHLIGEIEQTRDANAATAAAAAATATAVLRRRQLTAEGGELEVQPNVGQELLDVVTINDTLVSPSALTRRVRRLRWRYDRERGDFLQTLTLGAV